MYQKKFKELKDELFSKTNGGLDIINSIYPQSVGCSKFSIRDGDSTPSTSIKAFNGIYRLTDFGDRNISMDAIDVYQRFYNLDTPNTALLQLCTNYGINIYKDIQINKAEFVSFEKITAEEELQNDSDYNIKYKKFSEQEIRLWGPNVTEQNLNELGWSSVESITIYKQEKKKKQIIKSGENFPVFIQKCNMSEFDETHFFLKIYMPFNSKDKRFFTHGTVPKNYIYGFNLLESKYHKNKNTPLEKVVLCSGGSDAVNLLSYGYTPIYLNSETADFSKESYSKIMRYVQPGELYLMFDKDNTGIKQFNEICIRFLDIKGVCLPEMNCKDNRGNSFKDFKDFATLFKTQESVDNLFEKAQSLEFVKSVKSNIIVNDSALNRLFRTLGFYMLQTDIEESVKYIHIKDRVIERVSHNDISNSLDRWMEDRGFSDEMRNAVMKTKHLPSKDSSRLYRIKPNCKKHSYDEKYFFFNDTAIKINEEGVSTYSVGEMIKQDNYVLKENIIPRNIRSYTNKLNQKLFSIKKDQESGLFRIQIENSVNIDDYPLLKIFRNTSNAFWKKEQNNEPLSAQETLEIEHNMVSKIIALGMLACGLKIPSEPYAIVCLDACYDQDNPKGKNGGTGKSFFCNILNRMGLAKKFDIDGKTKSIENNDFLYDGVNKNTDYIFVDEVDFDKCFQHFYSGITSTLKVNAKREHPFSLDYSESPMFVFATNGLVNMDEQSTARRMNTILFSDYYHKQTKSNEYNETIIIRSDFGFELFDENYPEDKWMNDFHVVVQSIVAYLSQPIGERKIDGEMTVFNNRVLDNNIDEVFERFFLSFVDQSANLGKKHKILDFAQQLQLSSQKFGRMIKNCCMKHDYIYNPKYITGLKVDGENWRLGKSRESYFCIVEKNSIQTNILFNEENLSKPENLPYSFSANEETDDCQYAS